MNHQASAYSDMSIPSQEDVLCTILTTAVSLAFFVCVKTLYDNSRRKSAGIDVIVVGAGPVGLTAALIAARSPHVRSLIVVEEKSRSSLINRSYQVAFTKYTVNFLARSGIDFDNVEGCGSDGVFFTRSGVYQEYLLSVISRKHQLVDIRCNETFDINNYLGVNDGRQLFIVCDGANGSVARSIGLSDDYRIHSCKAFGSVAAIECRDQLQVPTAEKRVHDINLYLDETDDNVDDVCEKQFSRPSNNHWRSPFHFKIFGSARNRYMSIAVRNCDAALVKAMRQVSERSAMRSLFMKCFNLYKLHDESEISESSALKYMRFSNRLYEIRLSQRKEVAAYFEDIDTFVLVAGEAAKSVNFYTGMDVNTALKGLESLATFIELAASSESNRAILEALSSQFRLSDEICKDFVHLGLDEYVFT